MGERVLIIGSGPNAPEAADWPKAWFDRIVVINNAWRIRGDWDDHCYPEDFPVENRPTAMGAGQSAIEADQFVPAQNAYGGFVFAGATMAYTTAYWALHALRPAVMAFMGCDMVYASGSRTHFYGKGTADPLRDDVTLRDLEAKSARLGALAAVEGCACVNLSEGESRLLFPRARPEALGEDVLPAVERVQVDALRAKEAALGYETPTGRYAQTGYDLAALDGLDSDWRHLYLPAS